MGEWLDLSAPGVWIAVVAGLIAGLCAGVAAAWWFQRRSGAAASAAQLREELDGYRGDVNAHFEKTSELFRDLTERYRDLYEHLASGADRLCADEVSGQRLESSVRAVLTAGVAATDPESVRTGDSDETGTGTAEIEPAVRGVDSVRPLPEAAADTPVDARTRSA